MKLKKIITKKIKLLKFKVKKTESVKIHGDWSATLSFTKAGKLVSILITNETITDVISDYYQRKELSDGLFESPLLKLLKPKLPNKNNNVIRWQKFGKLK